MPNFPNSLDDNASLFLAVNNLRTQLTSPIDSSTLAIPVTSTIGFPDSGFITILTGTDITAAEAIEYTSKTATSFTASLRGAGSTTAATHDAGDNVDLTVVAAHHNELKDAIIELEQFVGVSGSEVFTPRFEFVAASGFLQSGIDDNLTEIVTVSGFLQTQFPAKGTTGFVTDVVPSAGGTLEVNEAFNNRALVRKLKIVPSVTTSGSYVFESFKSDTFAAAKLEYKATLSGTYIDNTLWFHEDEDGTSEFHARLTNNTDLDVTFTFSLIQEVFLS